MYCTRMFSDAAPTDRIGRYPKHTFLTKELPFTAQPFCLARVLPGESLTNLHMESRVVSDPVLNPLIGWKKEYYFFYVRVTDLMSDAIKNMFIDPTNAEISGMDEAANLQAWYCGKGAINWASLCMTRIVDTYFRDAGEVTADYKTAANIPIVQIRESSFLDSLTDKDDLPEGDAISGATDAGDLDRLMDAFEQLRMLGLADMTYEDFLRSYGIAIPQKDENKPELLARFSDFQYPSNTIDPADGSASSAVSYVFKQNERKPKFFKEPGFIVGVSISRPKIYFGGLTGSAAGWAQRAWDWMPNYLREMPETSLKNFAVDAGPLGDRTTNTDLYWLDMRDELLYGDQWQNMHAFDAAIANNDVGSINMLALPGTNLKWKYPSEAQCKSFFVDAAGTNFYMKQDGYVSLSIKGVQVDYTNRHIADV